MGKQLIALIVGALAVGLIAGCGSSGDGDSSTSSLTKAEFIRQGDAICVKRKSQFQAEISTFITKNAGSLKEANGATLAEAGITILVPALNEEVKELRALGIPSGDEKQVNAILVETESGLKVMEEEGKDLRVRPKELDKANKLAAAYGFKECVQT